MKTFFPNYEEVFGFAPDMHYVMQSTKPPKIIIYKDGRANVTSSVQMRFKNPIESKYDSLKLDLDVFFGIKFELLSNFTISGKCRTVKVEVTDMQKFFKSKVTM